MGLYRALAFANRLFAVFEPIFIGHCSHILVPEYCDPGIIKRIGIVNVESDIRVWHRDQLRFNLIKSDFFCLLELKIKKEKKIIHQLKKYNSDLVF